MSTFYNEIDPGAARWMRALMDAGDIAQGEVDERSIEDLEPSTVMGRGQRHFFAGIGGWSLALRLAGVPDDADVWTGSCPCQPFSSASRGRGGGFSSGKHLWPAWHRLIRECRPGVILGEQVATGDGGAWWAGVAAALEDLGYAVAAADLCSSILGFPARQRLFFVAYADGESKRARAIDGEVASIREAARVARLDRRDIHRVVSEGDGFPGAMGQRRGYGNAINPIIASAFVRAALGVAP